jgi:hypothetical protein
MLVINPEDRPVALRLLLLLILSVTSAVLVMAFGGFFAVSGALSDPDLTVTGLYCIAGLEVLTLALVITLFMMHLRVP